MSRLVKKSRGEWLLERKAGGSLNENALAYEVPDGECIELVNAIFRPMLWQKRAGYEKVLEIGESSDGIDGVFTTFFDDDDDRILAATGGYLYAVNADDWTYRELTLPTDTDGETDTLSTGYTVRFCMVNDVVYLTNGVQKVMKWRGGTNPVEYAGISDVPESVRSGISYDSGGSMDDGHYHIRATYYNSDSGLEGNYVDLGYAEIDSGSSQTKLSLEIGQTGDNTIDDQIDQILIYMTAMASTQDAVDQTVYYLAAEKDLADDDTYEVDIANADLIVKSTMDDIHMDLESYGPPYCKYIGVSKNRLFFGYVYQSGSWHYDRVAWGEIVGLSNTEYDYVKSTSYQLLTTQGGSITALVPWGDYVYIFHENGCVVLNDPSAPDVSVWQEMQGVDGCIASGSMQLGKFQRPVPAPPELKTEEFETVEGLVYLSHWGFVGFDGNQTYILSEKVKKALSEIAGHDRNNGLGLFSQGKYYYAYSKTRQNNNLYSVVYESPDGSTDEPDEAWLTQEGARGGYAQVLFDEDHSKVRNDIKLNLKIPTLNNYFRRYDEYKLWLVVIQVQLRYKSGDDWNIYGNFHFNNFQNKYNFVNEYRELTIRPGHQVTGVRIQVVPTLYYSDGFLWDHFFQVFLEGVQYYKIGGSEPYNTRMLYYDSLENMWSRWQGLNVGAFAALEKRDEERLELFGSNRNSSLYRINTGLSDDGKDIFFKVFTGYTDGKKPEKMKRWVKSKLTMDLGADAVFYRAWVDRLEKTEKQLNVIPDDKRVSRYGDTYGSYYNVGEGQKVLSARIGAAGKRLAEEIWSHGQDKIVVRGRTLTFVERE